jgi:hypothetical protein
LYENNNACSTIDGSVATIKIRILNRDIAHHYMQHDSNSNNNNQYDTKISDWDRGFKGKAIRNVNYVRILPFTFFYDAQYFITVYFTLHYTMYIN